MRVVLDVQEDSIAGLQVEAVVRNLLDDAFRGELQLRPVQVGLEGRKPGGWELRY